MLRLKKLRNVWLASFALIISCNKVEVPNTKWCSSIGIHGAICQESNTDQNSQMTIDEFIYFLEAQEDNKSTPENEEKGPALCTSSDDFAKIKTTIEQLCHKSGNKCTYEDKQLIRKMNLAYERLVNAVRTKK